MNKVFLSGYLGVDPELRYTQTQVPVCNLSLATHSKWRRDDGEWEEKTDWHRVVVFDKQAENLVKYLKKGSKALIDGRLQTRKYTDKNTGQDRYITEVIAKRVEFLDRPEEGQAKTLPSAATPPAELSEPVPLEEAAHAWAMLIIKYIDLWGEAHQRIFPEFDTLVEWLECGRAKLQQQCGEDVDEWLQKNFERFFDNGKRIKWWPEQLWDAPAHLRHLWSPLFVASVSGEVIEYAEAEPEFTEQSRNGN